MKCIIYRLEEAMLNFDNYFESVHVEQLAMRRLMSDPATDASDAIHIIVSKRVDDGIMVGRSSASTATRIGWASSS